MNYFALRGFPININTLNYFVIIWLQIFSVLYSRLQAVYKCPCKHGGLLCSSVLLTLKKHGTENKIVIFYHFIKVKSVTFQNAPFRGKFTNFTYCYHCLLSYSVLYSMNVWRRKNLTNLVNYQWFPKFYHPNFNDVFLMTYIKKANKQEFAKVLFAKSF